MVQEEGVAMRVVPVDVLYRQIAGQTRDQLSADVAEVYSRVTGQTIGSAVPQKEYDLI